MKIDNMIESAIDFVKDKTIVYDILNTEFEITDIGLYPYANIKNNKIYIPRSFLPILYLSYFNADDIYVDYILCQKLIESDFYSEAESLLERLIKSTYTSKKFNHIKEYQNIIIIEIIFSLLHELGHIAYSKGFRKEEYKSSVYDVIYKTKNNINSNNTEFKKTLAENIKSNNISLEKEYGGVSNFDIDSYVNEYFEHINYRLDNFQEAEYEELCADSFAIECFLISFKELMKYEVGMYHSCSACLEVLLSLSFYSVINGYIMNDQDMDNRISTNAARIKACGDTVLFGLRIDNLINYLQKFSLYEAFKNKFEEYQKIYNERLAKFPARMNYWNYQNIVNMYDGCLESPDFNKQKELISHYIEINQNLCRPLDIEY